MEKLQVHIVLEILGRPPENVKEALNTIVVRLGSEKGVKVLEKKYHDPVAVEGAKDLYTAFAEVSLELDSLDNYFGIMFAYMPSNIELVHPEEIVLTNHDLNQLAGKLTQRLHDYDAITKKMIFERDIVAQKLKQVAPHLFDKKSKKPDKKNQKSDEEDKSVEKVEDKIEEN